MFANLYQSSGTIATSSTFAHSGLYSFKGNITLANGYAQSRVFGSSNVTTFYIRFWLYYSTTALAQLDNNDDLFKVFSGYDYDFTYNTLLIGIYRNAGVNYLVIWYDNLANAHLIAAPSADAWHCIEVYLKSDAVNGVITSWLDGVQFDSDTGNISAGNGISNWYFGVIESVGFVEAVYLDDIVIDDSRYIGTGWRVGQDGAVGSPYQY